MTYVTADIHGNIDALDECLDKVNFSDSDTLISLGDMVDGHLYTKQVIERLMSIKNFIGVRGNHSDFLLDTYYSGVCKPIHYKQGGKATMESYEYKIPKEHKEFIEKMPYYLIKDNYFFCHGGIPYFLFKKLTLDNVDKLLATQGYNISWDRTLMDNVIAKGLDVKNKPFDKIFIGHTDTRLYKSEKPIIKNGLYCLDTGAGWDGKLTFYCLETDKFYQSKKSTSHRGLW